MTGRPRVLVAAGSSTLGLRLRLMLEAEGAEVLMPGDGVDGDLKMVVATSGQVEEAGRLAPRVPIVQVEETQNWDALRSRLADALCSRTHHSEADELAAALARARILLVDDSATFREFLRAELTRMGAQVTVCSNAEEALSKLTQATWDCVLVDLVMPGVDGAQLCGRAAQLRRDTRQTFVLAVLSSREGKADLIRSLEAGADVFIGKSQDILLFRAKLGAALRRRFLPQ